MIDFANKFTSKHKPKRSQRTVNTLVVDEEPTPMEPLFVPRIYAITSFKKVKNSQLPYIQVVIKDLPFTALIDSGASISYMKLSTANMLGIETVQGHDPFTAKAANGTNVQLLATVMIPIQIGTYLVEHQFQVSTDEHCPAPLLLGSDFLRRINENGLKITIDLHRKIFTIGNEDHSLIQLNSVVVDEPYNVRLTSPNTLLKRTSNLVEARIDGYYSTAPSDFLVEDNNRPSPHIYIVGRALVRPQFDGVCMINILNPSYTNIHLYAGMNIARATPLVNAHLQVHSVQVVNPTIAYVPPEADWESKMPRFSSDNAQPFDVTDEIDLSKSALDDQQQEQLKNILRSHSNAFVGPDGHLGHYRGPIRHRIDLVENAETPARKIYRVPLEKRAEIERQITQMLKDGIIRESTSPFCAPIVLISNKGFTKFLLKNPTAKEQLLPVLWEHSNT
ncbi:retroviral aspartyl protease [Oesophagostomum dentatum]|uniref:Retroviral aspartyl protease n=1 Tax=Oesophagostomum dentatum TaxID=61180 RepID=A0A0B1TLV7_OESDE|nr:retroviral aspartyl protease [Oesophagostomum dentatum]